MIPLCLVLEAIHITGISLRLDGVLPVSCTCANCLQLICLQQKFKAVNFENIINLSGIDYVCKDISFESLLFFLRINNSHKAFHAQCA
jgi:hypothetical protein